MISLQDSLIKNGKTMDNEYISPKIQIVRIFLESAILSASVKEPVLEDFDVSDGEW
jgi:hypothetical protein